MELLWNFGSINSQNNAHLQVSFFFLPNRAINTMPSLVPMYMIENISTYIQRRRQENAEAANHKQSSLVAVGAPGESTDCREAVPDAVDDPEPDEAAALEWEADDAPVDQLVVKVVEAGYPPPPAPAVVVCPAVSLTPDAVVAPVVGAAEAEFGVVATDDVAASWVEGVEDGRTVMKLEVDLISMQSRS